MARHSRTIRKITLGDNPLDRGLALVVGHSAGPRRLEYKISAIREDDQNHIEYGITRYTVYIQKDDELEIVWKQFERVPISIEYGIPGDGPDVTYVG